MAIKENDMPLIMISRWQFKQIKIMRNKVLKHSIMKLLLLTIGILGIGGAFANPTPRRFVSTPERVKGYGYPLEEHTVQTSDGYILQMFRIPYSQRLNNKTEKDKPTVFLMHGLLSSSDCWILNGPENAIAFLLVDAGYDVWMGNARGNVYSKNHATKSPWLPPFWDFEWHEIGLYDLPAMLDYILYMTNQEALHYIGHSQGTTALMVLLSTITRYNDIIKSANLLAPIGYMDHMQSPLATVLGPLLGTPLLINDLMGNSEFMPSNKLIHMLGPVLCEENSLFVSMCSNVFFLIAGWDSIYINETMLVDISETHPAGSSTNQLIHYLQEYNSGYFRQYDHGKIINKKKYNSKNPPDYALENIRPLGDINLFYTENDLLAAEKDVHRLVPRLGGKVNKLRVKFRQYNHLDVMWAINVKDVIYDCIVDKINEYEGRQFTGKKCNNFRKF